MSFTPQELWAHTGTPVRIVIYVMLFLAIWCVYIAIERWMALKKAREQSRELASVVSGPLAGSNPVKALSLAVEERFAASYLGHILAAGLTEWTQRPDNDGIKAAERALERAAINEGANLRKGLNVLATTGATTPFVGLVGTIFGIINAFSGMAEAGGGGLGAISGGIAEALITTAIGITVAIIGVWLFNYYTARIDAITNDINISIGELLDWCHKQLLDPVPALVDTGAGAEDTSTHGQDEQSSASDPASGESAEEAS